MGDGGCEQAASFPPCPAIEDARDGSQDDVTPVEHGPLVEVRQTKQDGSKPQGASTRHVPFQQVLHQAAEIKFFRQRHKEKGKYPSPGKFERMCASAMPVEKAHGEPERDDDG